MEDIQTERYTDGKKHGATVPEIRYQRVVMEKFRRIRIKREP